MPDPGAQHSVADVAGESVIHGVNEAQALLEGKREQGVFSFFW